jgi:hypothetical protein
VSALVAAQYPVLSTTSLASTNDENSHTNTGNYAMDTANERNQYVGTWEYNQNGVLFEVKIEKKEQELLGVTSISSHYFYADVVTFKYRLVKNGQEVFNNLNQAIFTGTDFMSSAIKEGGDNYASGVFYDKTRNVQGVVTIKKLNTTPEKITFEVPLGAYHLMNPPAYYEDGQPLFSIPTGEIEMVKVE